MRIAFTNATDGMVGGAERYIGAIGHRLFLDGHQLALWFEGRHQQQYEDLGPDVFEFKAELQTTQETEWIDSLIKWRPDLIFGQGLYRPSAEAATLAIGPSVYFAHDYKCICLSGSKSHRFPHRDTCLKPLGAMCLVHYLPRGCGGSSPLTMIGAYRQVTSRLHVVKQYSKILTHSRWVQTEYARNGMRCDLLPYFSTAGRASGREWERGKEWNLLVLGRLVKLKGGDILLRALPRVARALDTSVKATFVGDGPALDSLKSLANSISREEARVSCEFTGWLSSPDLDDAIERADLHVMPGFWPEPYGMVGIEAAHHGVPSVAFAIGGIPEWLKHGHNGMLADYVPPLEEKLSDAIVCSLANEAHYCRLRLGAIETAARLSIDRHFSALMGTIERVLAGSKSGISAPAVGSSLA